MARRTATTTQKGLGYQHQKTRAALLPLAVGKHCGYCGGVMLAGQKLELDHAIPRVLGGRDGPVRMVHARCNHRAGAILGNRIRWGAKRVRSRW